MTHESYLDFGLYSYRDAAHLLKLDLNTLQYWLGEVKDVESVIQGRFREEHVLTFAELMELHFIKMFRDEHVSFQAIRRAAQESSKKFHTSYPFIVKRFDTDGRSIFATLKGKETNQEVVEELHHGQLVFTKIIRPFFRKLDYSGLDTLQRFWPLKKSGRIVLDPTRHFGKPIDSQTGVPVYAIVNAAKAGDGQDAQTVAKWFEIPVDAVEAAIRFDRSLAS